MGQRFVSELGGKVIDTGPRGTLYEVHLHEDDPEKWPGMSRCRMLPRRASITSEYPQRLRRRLKPWRGVSIWGWKNMLRPKRSETESDARHMGWGTGLSKYRKSTARALLQRGGPPPTIPTQIPSPSSLAEVCTPTHPGLLASLSTVAQHPVCAGTFDRSRTPRCSWHNGTQAGGACQGSAGRAAGAGAPGA